jgi:uncharacterized protein (DUF1697 family)
MTVDNQITINGFTFLAPTPYTEGHVCTGAEAAILNRRLHAALRNNFGKHMDTLVLEGKTIEDQQRQIFTEFANYCATYSLNGADPVDAEARAIATAIVKNKIRSNGGVIGDYTKAQLEVFITDILASSQRQEIYEQARARLKVIREAAKKELARVSS